jgi:hypothetical protein
MILLGLITIIVFGPAAYFFAPGKTSSRRLTWTAVAVFVAYALEMAFFIYFGDWLAAD